MRLFGLYGHKPMALARISGMGLLRDRRRDATPVSTSHYLRHASALSALIAANLSGVVDKPGGGDEMTHTPSSSASLSGVDGAQFAEAHAQYSFIAVVALMSLFLFITVTATGIMLAFCRKKNAVFTAPEKTDADSNLELDDIDNSDVDICRGEKGECYYHLSDDDYDDDDDDDDDNSVCKDKENAEDSERSRTLSKRSRTFPQLKKVLVRRRGKVRGIGKETEISTANELLMDKEESAISEQQANDAQQAAIVCSGQASQGRDDAVVRQGPKPVCRNPNHRHYSRKHHNCLYNRPHFHNANQHRHLYCAIRPQHFNPSGGSRLQRSHTIHYIPQTDPVQWDHRGPTACGVKIRVQGAETIALCDQRAEAGEVGTVQLHHVPTVSSSVDRTDDLFTDHDLSFTNLQLRLDDGGNHRSPTDYSGQSFHDPNTPTNPTPWPVCDNYTADQNVRRANQASNDSGLLGEFLTCNAGSHPPSDCIFNREKTHFEVDATPQTCRHEQMAPVPHNHYPSQVDSPHSQASQLKSFHNLFTLETHPDSDLTALVISANATQSTSVYAPNSESPPPQSHTALSACILPPPRRTSSKRLIRHPKSADGKTGDQEFRVQWEISNTDTLPTQRVTGPHVDLTFSRPDCNSNYGAGDRQPEPRPQPDLNILTDPDVSGKKNLDALAARPVYYSSRSPIRPNEARRDEDGDYENGEVEEEDECNDVSARLVNAKTCNEIGSDEDQDDLTLSLLK